ncbi:MAG: ribonuclease HI family protein [Coriobacteriia bacterium]|nr:ribonuclease HI family protein [Coriobacteriia bacterium]
MQLSSPAHWVLYTDGGSRGNPGPAGSGFVLRDGSGAAVCAAGYFIGEATNNRAEYDGLIRGLSSAASHGCRSLEVRMDSELIVRQMTGRYRVKNDGLKEPFARAKALMGRFDHVSFVHVPREENTEADRLANEAMDERRSVGDAIEACEDEEGQGTLF